jgi:hypothetical protein
MLGDIGIFLRTKKVSFPSCWGNGDFLEAKKVSSMLSEKLAPFSGQRKVLVHPTGKIGTFSWQRKFNFQPAGEIGTFLTAKKVSFPSCWGNGHLSHGKEISFSTMLVTILPFSFSFQAGIFFTFFCYDKFSFFHTETVFTFSCFYIPKIKNRTTTVFVQSRQNFFCVKINIIFISFQASRV